MPRVAMLLAAVLGATTLACTARRTITETQGQSSAAIFARQVPPRAKPTGPGIGLDPQEANIIADVYRQSLAPKKAKVSEEPIIMVAPPARQSATPTLPPPSVPKER